MKVLCIHPRIEWCLHGGRTYTALSEFVCPGCSKIWYEIAEAVKPRVPAGTKMIGCGVCDADLVGLTIERESHLFRASRFIYIGPDEHDKIKWVAIGKLEKIVGLPTNEELLKDLNFYQLLGEMK